MLKNIAFSQTVMGGNATKEDCFATSGYWILTPRRHWIDYIQRLLTYCQDNNLLKKGVNNQRTVIYSHSCSQMLQKKALSLNCYKTIIASRQHALRREHSFVTNKHWFATGLIYNKWGSLIQGTQSAKREHHCASKEHWLL